MTTRNVAVSRLPHAPYPECSPSQKLNLGIIKPVPCIQHMLNQFRETNFSTRIEGSVLDVKSVTLNHSFCL